MIQTNPIAVALKAKGLSKLYHRAYSIIQRYGLNPDRMDQALQQFSLVLGKFNCGATFPITAVTLKRHASIIAKYREQNIEFAVHGFTHSDYTQLTPETQTAHLRQAREVFTQAGIQPVGFRAPYLQHNNHLYTAVEAAGFSYVSNQTILWDVLPRSALAPSQVASSERALAFYEPWLEGEHLSLPQKQCELIEIPVALPDDEILIERLGADLGLITNTWRCILAQTYQRGELFTLQLHPERIALCADALSAVLQDARSLYPKVWCARLDQIAAWWKAREGASLTITSSNDEGYSCTVSGPEGSTVLVRGVDVSSPTRSWKDEYQIVEEYHFTFYAHIRPFIGISPSTSQALAHFLREQGYFIETSLEPERYGCYLDQADFDAGNEFTVLSKIENSGCPILKLGRWPNGAQSAMAITGDIDALTLWDYGLRALGK